MRIVSAVLFWLSLAVIVAPEAAAQFEDPAMPCPIGSAEAWLRGADVEAALFTNGNLFFGNTTTNGDGYIVPPGELARRAAVLASVREQPVAWRHRGG